MPSPAEIIRSCLVDAGVVVMPPVSGEVILYQQLPGDGTTVCVVSSMPDEPDQVVCLLDVAGMQFGRAQASGQMFSHAGLIVNIRALHYKSGYALANTIALALQNITNNFTVIDGIDHYVQSAYRTSTVVSLGEEIGKKRQLFSFNARVAFLYQESYVG